jgi:tight adherence protein C
MIAEPLVMMRGAFVGAIGVSILAGVYGFASAPSRTASRLGLRGLKRQRALEQSEQWRKMEPLVRWLGVRISGVISDEMYMKLDAQIALGGDYLGLTPEELVAMSILACLGGLAFGVVAGSLSGVGAPMVPLCGMGAAALPWFQVSGQAEQRLKDINRGLPAAIDLIALSMSAGLDFPGAIRQVLDKSSNSDDALFEELQLMLQELKLGRTRKQALQEFQKRVPIEAVSEFVGSVVQAEERGNPLVETLQVQAEAARRRRTVRAEEMAAKAGVQMLLPMTFLLLAILLLVVAPIGMSMMKGDF